MARKYQVVAASRISSQPHNVISVAELLVGYSIEESKSTLDRQLSTRSYQRPTVDKASPHRFEASLPHRDVAIDSS